MAAKEKTIRCAARVHAVLTDDGHLRIRCNDRACPDVIAAKARGERAFHVYDRETLELVRTEFEGVT